MPNLQKLIALLPQLLKISMPETYICTNTSHALNQNMKGATCMHLQANVIASATTIDHVRERICCSSSIANQYLLKTVPFIIGVVLTSCSKTAVLPMPLRLLLQNHSFHGPWNACPCHTLKSWVIQKLKGRLGIVWSFGVRLLQIFIWSCCLLLLLHHAEWFSTFAFLHDAMTYQPKKRQM